MSNLATLYGSQGRYDKAEPLRLETLETRKRVLGEDHPDTLWLIYSIANVGALRGQPGEAFRLLRQALRLGFSGADFMAKDSDLESLHGPEFDALVEHARQNAAAQRAE